MFRLTRAARWSAIGVLLICCVGCDQATKRIAIAQLKGRAAHSFLGDVVRLEYAENPGAFLGLGGNLPPDARWMLLTVLNCTLAAAIAATLAWRREMGPLMLVACTLLLAGAIGNLIDRLRFDGLVIDFLNLGVGPLRTGIFNVADMAITLGAVLLIWAARTPTPRQGQPAPVEG